MTHDWVYIATPSGADLGKTIQLADGSVFPVGVIRRSTKPSRPYVDKLKPGDTMLLTYNLFHTGIVYPIGMFTIQHPKHENDLYVVPLDPMRYPAVGALTRLEDRQRLEPDYVSESTSEQVLLGELTALEPKEALKVYRRVAPGDNALHPATREAPLKEIGEAEAGRLLEEALVPSAEPYQQVLSEAASSRLPVDRLDGRAKQLLIEWRVAERALPAGARSYALPAFPLCLLIEYEVQRLLAGVARRRLRAGRDLSVGRGTEDLLLSWIPDPTVYGAPQSFGKCIRMLKQLRAEELGLRPGTLRSFRDALYRVREFRNRVAHSYFLEGSHYRDLQQLVAGLLASLHSPR
jgi:hypothetical protein